MDLDKLKTFYLVGTLGGVNRAAKRLGLSHAAISRQMTSLQQSVGEQLLSRTPKGMILTEKGELLLGRVRELLSEVESIKEELKCSAGSVKGEIKFSATAGLTAVFLMYYIPGFLELHPEIKLTILGSEHYRDLTVGEVDAEIRTSLSGRPGLEHVYLTTCHLKLYASKKYIEKFGVPKSAEELDNHRLIAFGDKFDKPYADVNWHLKVGAKHGHERNSYLNINSVRATFLAGEFGIGIISVPEEVVLLNKSPLIQILPDIESPKIDLYFVYPKAQEKSRRTMALRDYLKSVLSVWNKDDAVA
ncbi:MAG: LysR family transcriptional regulator [Alphaproteobacteria bacterium]|jgi:DNA-binding transcriptional LysR family regulator|nr:LysR family transcriptional regulator [Alphaproteobacteria bacterium]MBT5389211.1 LysR family transcriptional regulator [Alphaproteobacteria bacterium]MBT5654819.1 LysR family transcriptional regulator [Alphaproteobacteria bacterium]